MRSCLIVQNPDRHRHHRGRHYSRLRRGLVGNLDAFPSVQVGQAFGITIWPQGMIPRHREKLAQSIGNAVGNELVSQQTVFDALFETSFFQRKVEDFVGSYTNDLLGRVYPSFIDALPVAGTRADSRHDLGTSVSTR